MKCPRCARDTDRKVRIISPATAPGGRSVHYKPLLCSECSDDDAAIEQLIAPWVVE